MGKIDFRVEFNPSFFIIHLQLTLRSDGLENVGVVDYSKGIVIDDLSHR